MAAIDLSRDGAVFLLTMNAGENRFNRGFVDTLNGALDEVEKSSGPAALVTTGGSEKFYSNGLDLGWMGSDEGRNEGPRFVQAVMDLFDGVGIAEGNDRRPVPFLFRLLDECRIHLLELMPLAFDGSLEVLFRVLHAAHDPQVGMGVNGFRSSSRTEQLGDLGTAFGVGFGGERKVLPVGLAFTGKCGLKVVLG